MSDKRHEFGAAVDAMGGFDAVFAVIGRIMANFAKVESQLADHLLEALGYPPLDRIGLAIVSRMTTDDMWRLLKTAMEARQAPEHSCRYVDDIRKYIIRIKRYRNIFAHNTFGFSEHPTEGVIIAFMLGHQRGKGSPPIYQMTKRELDSCLLHSDTCALIIGSLYGAIRGMDVAAINDDLKDANARLSDLPPLPEAQAGYRF